MHAANDGLLELGDAPLRHRHRGRVGPALRSRRSSRTRRTVVDPPRRARLRLHRGVPARRGALGALRGPDHPRRARGGGRVRPARRQGRRGRHQLAREHRARVAARPQRPVRAVASRATAPGPRRAARAAQVANAPLRRRPRRDLARAAADRDDRGLRAAPEQDSDAAVAARRARGRARRGEGAAPSPRAPSAHADRARRHREDAAWRSRSRRGQDRFPSGVFFVALAAARDADAVLSAIAQTLGGARAPGERRSTRSRDELRDKHLLLVLDNLEQVLVAAAPRSPSCWRPPAAPGRSPRAASRCGSRGEHELARSAPLAATREAVALFVERARAVDPRLRADDGERRARFATICARLDGLPLAIELAAARVNLLAPAELLGAARQPLLALADARRPRRSRRASRRCARRSTGATSCSTTASGRCSRGSASSPAASTLEAAEAGRRGGDVLDDLASLVDKSLVRRDDDRRRPRFELLETIREYALERLDESGEQDERPRASRPRTTSRWPSAPSPSCSAPASRPGSHRLEREHDNLRAAFEWFRGRAPPSRSCGSRSPSVRSGSSAARSGSRERGSKGRSRRTASSTAPARPRALRPRPARDAPGGLRAGRIDARGGARAISRARRRRGRDALPLGARLHRAGQGRLRGLARRFAESLDCRARPWRPDGGVALARKRRPCADGERRPRGGTAAVAGKPRHPPRRGGHPQRRQLAEPARRRALVAGELDEARASLDESLASPAGSTTSSALPKRSTSARSSRSRVTTGPSRAIFSASAFRFVRSSATGSGSPNAWTPRPASPRAATTTARRVCSPRRLRCAATSARERGRSSWRVVRRRWRRFGSGWASARSRTRRRTERPCPRSSESRWLSTGETRAAPRWAPLHSRSCASDDQHWMPAAKSQQALPVLNMPVFGSWIAVATVNRPYTKDTFSVPVATPEPLWAMDDTNVGYNVYVRGAWCPRPSTPRSQDRCPFPSPT